MSLAVTGVSAAHRRGLQLPRQATKARTLRLAIYLLCLTTLAGIAGCAPREPAEAGGATGIGRAWAQFCRCARWTSHSAIDPMRAALLADGSAPGDADRSLVEFIVRADDGATLSIVQSNEAGFRTGDRVIILRDDRTRLARPG